MKPEHLDWIDAIWSRLIQVTGEVLAMPPTDNAGETVAG
jgi:hypothetical protein